MKKYLVLVILLNLSALLHAQDLRVHVLNENAQPLAGAVLRLKGSAQTAITGEDGIATIKRTSRATDTLNVFFVGYVNASRAINMDQASITMILVPAIKQMEEVIVSTGYQQLPKERSTGSFVNLDKKLLDQQVTTDIISKLEAIASSVNISRRVNNPAGQLSIRGLSSIKGPTAPLIVLDNFPYDGDIQNINPNEVQSITILKDAAAASLWGARAGNGVIVITTTRAKYNEKIAVDLNLNSIITGEPDLYYTPQLSVRDFIEVERFLFSKGYRFSDTSRATRPPFSPVYEILFLQRSGKISPSEAEARISEIAQHDLRVDAKKYLYQRAVNKQVSLSMHGGSANMNWLMSVGYDNNRSVTGAPSDRLNIRAENNLRLLKGVVTLSTGLYLTNASSAKGRPALSDLSVSTGRLQPYIDLTQPLAKDYRQPYIDTAGAGYLLNWQYRPLEDYQFIDNKSKTSDRIANLALNLKLSSTLNVDLRYQLQEQQVNTSTLYDERSYFARNLINAYAQLNRTTGVVTYKIPRGSILDESNAMARAGAARAQLNYDQQFADHRITAIAGAELRERLVGSGSARSYGYNDDLLTTVNVDYVTSFPNFISGATAFIPAPFGRSESRDRFVSVYTNGAYTFKNKYTASFSARSDASNLFGVATNDKWSPLWSAGLSWELSKENWFTLKKIAYVKLRATYGYAGNVDQSLSALTTFSITGTNPYTVSPMGRVQNFYNPDLRWEKTGQLNLGLDFRSATARIAGSLEYYRKRGRDLYGSDPIDITVGLATNVITKNVAAMQGQGIDLELNTLNLKRVWEWRTNLVLSYNTDKVTDYYLANTNLSPFINKGTSISGLPGKPLYSIFTYRFAGIDAAGDPLVLFNGQPSKDYANIISKSTFGDLHYIGRATPAVFGSLGNSFSYKGLSVNVRMLFKFGYYYQLQGFSSTSLIAGQGHPDYAARWQKPGDENATTVPAIVYPANGNRDAIYTNSDLLTERGDNIRLQYINLAYELPQLKCLPVKRLQLYTTISNLGLVWKASAKRFDPDYQDNIIPPSVSVAFGLRTNF